MATIVAQANGNFSDTATWTGGVVPGAGDTAQTGNYIVTIDASITCTLNPTGSGYFLVTSGGITITGDLVMSSSYTGGGLRCTHTAGTVELTGTATGGAGTYAYGAANTGAGTLTVGTATGGAGANAYGAYNGAGTMTVGTATGGAGYYAHGAVNEGAGTLTIGTATGGAGGSAYGAANTGAGTLTVGTATGGAGNNAYGAYNAAAGTLTIGTATGGAGGSAHGAFNGAAGTLTVGTATAGAGNYAYGAYNAAAGTLTVDLAVGNGWGVGGSGGYAYGVYGSGATGQTTRVKRTQSGPYGAPAIGGAVLMLADASNSAQFRTAYGGGTLTLTDPSASADWPAESDVRAGVQYDNGDQTGTAHIPAAGSVALGIPVDATVGTAVLTAAAVTAGVWDAARSGHAGAGTFGATDEWAGSVDEAAIADAVLSAMDAAPPAVNVTHHAGVAVAAADANGNVPVVLYGTQGAVTFGQVKILANVPNQGALHVVNSHANGHGQYSEGGNTGQYNNGNHAGQTNTGNYAGQTNYGGAAAVVGAAQQEIADALKRAPAAGTPAAGSVYAKLDGIGGSVAAELSNSSDCTASGAISRTRGNTWIINATVGAITGYTSLWLTIKHSRGGPDSDAILQVKLNASGVGDGLLYVNGTPASDSAKAAITVNNAATGTITITVDEVITAALPVGEFAYDIQTLVSGVVATPDSGAFTVTADVTRSIV